MRCGELVPRDVKLERFTTPDIIGHHVLGHGRSRLLPSSAMKCFAVEGRPYRKGVRQD